MKVLIVHPCKDFYGGAEEVIVKLTNYLIGKRHKVLVILKDTPLDLCSRLPVSAPSCGARTTHSWKTFYLEVQKELNWADVINVHNFPATLMPWPKKKPIVYMCNEPAELFTNWWRKPIEAFNRWWVKNSKMKIVVADEMNSFRFYELYRVEPKVIPYGVDYKFWSGGDRLKGRDGFRLLQVGTISPYKNQMESVKTLEEIQGKVPYPAVLDLIGKTPDSSYLNEILSYTRGHGIYHVTRHPHLPPESTRSWYNYADVLLHPIMGQGGWLVPFEAMCVGLPVITTHSFSAASLIEKNKLGIVTGDMASSIINGDYKELDLEYIKRWVKENLTWEKFGEGMVKTFEEAIE